MRSILKTITFGIIFFSFFIGSNLTSAHDLSIMLFYEETIEKKNQKPLPDELGTFQDLCTYDGGTSSTIVKCVLVGVTDNVSVWILNSYWQTDMYTFEQGQSIADWFQNDIYNVIVGEDKYGLPHDYNPNDGNTPVYIMIADLSGINAMGVYSPSVDNSNQVATVTWDFTALYDRGTLIHEFQHAIHANYEKSSLMYTNLWFNEGMSELVPTFLGFYTTKNWTNKMDSNWGYIKGGADYALCYWDSTGYVANFVFNWYLYEHYGGLEFLGRVMRAPREQEPRCNYTIQNLDYLLRKEHGISLDEVFSDYVMANYLQQWRTSAASLNPKWTYNHITPFPMSDTMMGSGIIEDQLPFSGTNTVMDYAVEYLDYNTLVKTVFHDGNDVSGLYFDFDGWSIEEDTDWGGNFTLRAITASFAHTPMGGNLPETNLAVIDVPLNDDFDGQVFVPLSRWTHKTVFVITNFHKNYPYGMHLSDYRSSPNFEYENIVDKYNFTVKEFNISFDSTISQEDIRIDQKNYEISVDPFNITSNIPGLEVIGANSNYPVTLSLSSPNGSVIFQSLLDYNPIDNTWSFPKTTLEDFPPEDYTFDIKVVSRVLFQKNITFSKESTTSDEPSQTIRDWSWAALFIGLPIIAIVQVSRRRRK